MSNNTIFVSCAVRGGKTLEMARLKSEAEAKGIKTLTITKEMAEESRKYYQKQRDNEMYFWLMFGGRGV